MNLESRISNLAARRHTRSSSKAVAHQMGFTLIELSIVLVVIGLIVGGVIVGQDLIKQTEFRSIISDWQEHETSVRTFKLKYNCIPGDCDNASTLGLGANGNGGKFVDHYATSTEAWKFWNHLANAGLVEGGYTGLAGAGGAQDSVLGENVPKSQKSGVGYSILCIKPISAAWPINWGIPASIQNHLIGTGKDTSTGNSQTWGGAFLPTEALNINQKIDDGLANSGRVRSINSMASHDTLGCTSGVAPDYAYDTSDSGLCNLAYLFQP